MYSAVAEDKANIWRNEHQIEATVMDMLNKGDAGIIELIEWIKEHITK